MIFTYFRPANDPKNTTMPDLRCLMYGRKERVTFKVPKTFVLWPTDVNRNQNFEVDLFT